MEYLIAYDLGTGGIKSSLYTRDGACAASAFHPYDTIYPEKNRHEQRPMDWWRSVCGSTRTLLRETGVHRRQIACAALSGQSQVVAPLDARGELLLERVPIWSDTRAEAEAEEFFTRVGYGDWYLKTGNGDPPACYSIFKLMWMKAHQREAFDKARIVLGSKDFINFKLTGAVATDRSYASGSGAFDLIGGRYRPEWLEAAGIPPELLPPILDSYAEVGRVTEAAAAQTGLAPGTPVACGGVDNTCMALGALGLAEGRAYISLGSSAWVAVNCCTPMVDLSSRPFTFAHAQAGYYTSAMSIFSAGSGYLWAQKQLCRDIDERAALAQMDALASGVPAGSNGVLFNPSLAGGSAQEKSPHIRGAFTGLTLSTTREELLRAVLEGTAMNMALLVDEIAEKTPMREEILICGGGSRSGLWRQIFADILGRPILKTNVDQNAASLGAAAIAARCCGLWPDYGPIAGLHQVQAVENPDPRNHEIYCGIKEEFSKLRNFL